MQRRLRGFAPRSSRDSRLTSSRYDASSRVATRSGCSSGAQATCRQASNRWLRTTTSRWRGRNLGPDAVASSSHGPGSNPIGGAMADVQIQNSPEPAGDGGAGTSWAWVIVVLVLLALLAWFIFGRGGGGGDRDINAKVDVNVPGASSGGGGGTGGTGGGTPTPKTP